MKKSLVVLSGLAMSLLLTGCASSTTLDDQIRLIEYENCLETQRNVWVAKSKFYGPEVLNRLAGEFGDSDGTLNELFVERCKKNRP